MTKKKRIEKVREILKDVNFSVVEPLSKKDKERYLYIGKVAINNITKIDRIYKASGRCMRLDVTVNSTINEIEKFSCNEGMGRIVQFNYSHNNVCGLFENTTGFMIDMEEIDLKYLQNMIVMCKILQ